MKKLFILPFLILILTSCGKGEKIKEHPSFNVMTFNIRYDNPEDSLDNWQ